MIAFYPFDEAPEDLIAQNPYANGEIDENASERNPVCRWIVVGEDREYATRRGAVMTLAEVAQRNFSSTHEARRVPLPDGKVAYYVAY